MPIIPKKYEEGPPKTECIYKKLCIYSYILNFSNLQSALHLMQHTYRDTFSTA